MSIFLPESIFSKYFEALLCHSIASLNLPYYALTLLSPKKQFIGYSNDGFSSFCNKLDTSINFSPARSILLVLRQ